MALKLKQSPLPRRIEPPQPRRHWIWTEPGRYHAVYAQDEAVLLRLLQYPGLLFRLADGGFCLIFNDPVMLDPAETAGLTLRRIGPDSFASYPAEAKPPPRSLSIIAQGKPQLLHLDAAEPVEAISFWDFSQMPVITGRAPPALHLQIPKLGKSRTGGTPKLSDELRDLVSKSEPFKDVRSRVDAAADPRLRPVLSRTGRFLVRLIATAALLVFYFLVVSFALGLGGSIGPLGFILSAAFLLWFFGAFNGRTVGTGARKERGLSQQTRHVSRGGGGFLERLRGLALWNTPLGDNLRRDIQRNLEQVNRMIAQGNIDQALKRAMSLARDEKAKNERNKRLMTTPPKRRANLDFDLNRSSTETVSIPGDWGFEELRTKYKKLAQDLSEQGDHKRAAFIYAELLDLTKPAIAELEKMKAYDDAAKLATARKEDGVTIARLWFLAGKKEIALLMARRHNCMEQLAAVSEKDAKFSAFVRRHWVEGLIAEGNLPRAVQESADNPRLAETHLRALGKAVGSGYLQDHPVLERAIQCLPWPIDALNKAPSEQTVGGRIAQIVHTGVTESDAGEIRHALKRAAERMVKSDPRKPALADAIVRASLAFDAGTPYALPANDLHRFAQAQGCQALAEDLRQIHRSGPTEPRKNLDVRLPKSGHGKWSMVAALHRGAALVGTGTGEVALIDPQGVKRWTDHLPDLVGMVPIGAGRLVLLLQGRDVNRRISLLDTARHTYRPLGSTRLLAWDHYAGDGVWQVQTPEAIGSLDLTKILADAPVFEMLWSITQTIPVRVIAFQSAPFIAQWLTQRIGFQGPGLIEKWHLNRSTLNLTVFMESKTEVQNLDSNPLIWQGTLFSRLVSDDAVQKAFQFHGIPSNLEAEERLIADIGNHLIAREDFASITSVPERAAYAIELSFPDRSAIRLTHKDKQIIAQVNGHEIAAQSASLNGEHLVILTKSGLMILCNFKYMTVLVV